MPTRLKLPETFEFTTHNPPNLIVVENSEHQVLFRAAEDNFSDRRKAFLIRQLAAEGYIPDVFETLTEYSRVPGLTWVIDRSLFILSPEAKRRNHRFMLRLVVGGCVLWLVEVGLVLLTA